MSRKPVWPAIRNGILFFGGLFGVAYETVFRRPPDYGLLPVFAAMLGLPAFIRDREPPPEPSEPPVEPPAPRPRPGGRRRDPQ